MIVFSYILPDDSPKPGQTPLQRTLSLRNDPYEVSWTYNVNTQSYDTYGGQVIQVLSVNIDTLSISGQLGREGPFGVKKVSGPQRDERYGGPVPSGGFSTRNLSDQFDYKSTYPGLHAMVEFFREYFAVVTQGGDIQNPGRFTQIPVTLTYGGAPSHEMRQWIITPTNFPNFRRANDNFAPEWKIEAEVIQADKIISGNQKQAALDRLLEGIGFTPRNAFSDSAADPSLDINKVTNQIASQFKAILPKFSQGDIENMIWQGISVPSLGTTGSGNLVNTLDTLQGEIG